MRNIFIASIGISVLLHATAILGVPGLRFKPMITDIKKIREVRLIKTPPPQRFVPSTPPPQYLPIDTQPNLAPQSAAARISLKPQIVKPTTLSDEATAKALKKIPAYANYYHLIRDKIRTKAFSYYDSSTVGDMYLVFTVLSDGRLENLSVKEKESLGSEFLRQIAISSIKDASPFPPFPDELKKYEHLQFSVSISFKND
jgi:outer membrane biosynthesis protein TonB